MHEIKDRQPAAVPNVRTLKGMMKRLSQMMRLKGHDDEAGKSGNEAEADDKVVELLKKTWS